MSTYKLYYNNNGTPTEIPIASESSAEQGIARTTTTLSAELSSGSALTIPEHTVGDAGIMVYINGILVDSSMYTDASETTITFTSSVPSGSVIDVFVLTNVGSISISSGDSSDSGSTSTPTVSITGMTVVFADTYATVFYDNSSNKYYMKYIYPVAFDKTGSEVWITFPYPYTDTNYTTVGWAIYSDTGIRSLSVLTKTTTYVGVQGETTTEGLFFSYGEINYNG